MDSIRTDLALEAKELWEERAEETTTLQGVEAREYQCEGFVCEEVRILDERGEHALKKPVGTYITVNLEGLLTGEEGIFQRAIQAMAKELSQLLQPKQAQGLVLVVGLGNRAITPDALGPKVHDYTLVTRHLVEHMPEQFGGFRPVVSLASEVLGTTGMESGELVQAVCEKVQPSCVIAVDALAARSLERLCKTVQLCDTGITPGSGVGNHRIGLNERSLGVPVISIGVPTVVEARTLAVDLLHGQAHPLLEQGEGLFVTPKEIDRQVNEFAKVIGYGIGMALHQGVCLSDLEYLLG